MSDESDETDAKVRALQNRAIAALRDERSSLATLDAILADARAELLTQTEPTNLRGATTAGLRAFAEHIREDLRDLPMGLEEAGLEAAVVGRELLARVERELARRTAS